MARPIELQINRNQCNKLLKQILSNVVLQQTISLKIVYFFEVYLYHCPPHHSVILPCCKSCQHDTCSIAFQKGSTFCCSFFCKNDLFSKREIPTRCLSNLEAAFKNWPRRRRPIWAAQRFLEQTGSNKPRQCAVCFHQRLVDHTLTFPTFLPQIF